MFDNTNFIIKDGEVYFTTTVTPVSKFFSAEKENKTEYIIDSDYSLKNRLAKYVLIELEKPKTETFNSTRHKYNPTRNVQDALQRAEEHQAKNGREENKEAERFGDGIYWMLRPTTEKEKKAISDLEAKQRDLGKGISQYDTLPKNVFDGKGYEADKVLNGWCVEADKKNEIQTLEDLREKAQKGIKHSSGKLFYELDFNFIKQLAERMQQNKENSKYALWNWKKKMTDEDIENLKQALLRHVLAVMEGKYEDDGRPFGHLESISNNAMMINYQLKQK